MKLMHTLKQDTLSLSFEVFPPKQDAAFDSVKKATEEIAKLRRSADALKEVIAQINL